MTLRLAMWSGPRNLSTAMMRAWENRDDTTVVDEPFYACYLHATGIDHPLRAQVLASQSTDWQRVAQQLTQGAVDEPIQYQKHMTHHMINTVDLSWTQALSHCFLIRDPQQVVSSYARKRATVGVEDIGIKRQFELYQEISTLTGQDIPVLDSTRTLADPASTLQSLCERLAIPFTDAMLHWRSGPRASDGVWAPHWYQSVLASTGFRPYRETSLQLTTAQQRVAEQSMPYYRKLLARS